MSMIVPLMIGPVNNKLIIVLNLIRPDKITTNYGIIKNMQKVLVQLKVL